MIGKGIHSSVGSAVSLPLSLLLLIFFFLPWVDLTCGGEKVGSASGWQLTVGQMTMEKEQEEKPDSEDGPKARPWFILCLILPVALLTVGAMAVTGRWPSAGAGKVLLVLGVVGLIMMILAANVDYSHEINEQMQKEQAAKPPPPSGVQPGMEAMGEQVAGEVAMKGIETRTRGILWVSLVLYILVGACGAANLFLPRLVGAPTAAASPPAQPPPAQPPAEPPAQT